MLVNDKCLHHYSVKQEAVIPATKERRIIPGVMAKGTTQLNGGKEKWTWLQLGGPHDEGRARRRCLSQMSRQRVR